MAVFPYYSTDGGSFPVIPLVFLIGQKRIRAQALVDSGATISVFGKETAEALGVEIETGEKTILGGVGGRIVGYIHKLRVRTADKKFICPIVFSQEYFVSFNLLGREEVFKRFEITFEENRERVKIE